MVKLEFPQHHIDIVYQHVWNNQLPASTLIHSRARVWTKLHQLISSVAQRNILVICGDFNCPLSQAKGHTGPGVIESSNPPADQSAFDSVLQTHGLVALNTWGRRSKAHTYEVKGCRAARTQIDFILTRRGTADSAARTSHPRQDLHLCSWRGGGRHLAIQASVPSRCYQPRPQPVHKYDRDALVEAVQTGGPALDRLKQVAGEGIHKAETPMALNQVLIEACQQVFPHRKQVPFIPWQQPETAHTLKDMWSCYRQANQHAREAQQTAREMHNSVAAAGIRPRREAAGRTQALLSSLLSLWRSECNFKKLHARFRRSGRQLRKERSLRLLDVAEAAARAHNQKELFDVIRRLAPKQPRRRVQLRGETNQLLTNQQELSALVTFSEDLFQHDRPPLATAKLYDRYQLTAEQLMEAMRALQPRKSSPRHLAPNAAWKGLAELLTPKILGWYGERGEPAFPRLWTDAWVVWLAKPNKPPDKPSNLRPIALQDGGGKAVARAMQQAISPWIQKALVPHPQFAYIKGRLVETAVLRAVQHCRQARDLLAAASPNIQQRHRGAQTKEFCGSAILSLDLSQAFDRVDRPKLLTSLQRTGMPDQLIQSVAHWHDQIHYHLQVGGGRKPRSGVAEDSDKDAQCHQLCGWR